MVWKTGRFPCILLMNSFIHHPEIAAKKQLSPVQGRGAVQSFFVLRTCWVENFGAGPRSEPANMPRGLNAMTMQRMRSFVRCGVKEISLNPVSSGWRPSVTPSSKQRCILEGVGRVAYTICPTGCRRGFAPARDSDWIT